MFKLEYMNMWGIILNNNQNRKTLLIPEETAYVTTAQTQDKKNI